MIYGNLDSIQRKLNNRLKIDSSEFYPVEEVDNDLIVDIAEEKENLVNLYLAQVYDLPLRNRQPVVITIVENLIMAKLIDYEFINNSGGNDLTNFSYQCKKEAFNLLYQIVAGLGIPIPEADSLGYYSQMNNNTPLILPGEVFTQDLPKANTSNNFTYIGTILNDDYTVNDFLIKEEQCNNPFSMDYRR